MPAWRDAGARVRAAVCLEIVDAINQRSFEMAGAVMHTTGQPFVMAFQAAGPHAQDRALESIVAGLVEQERVPATVVWEKPAKDAPIRMQKDYRVVPRGIALVIGCNTFPTWNGYPGLFASLVTGNPVIVKPHPRAVLPLAISVEAARSVLRDAGFDPALVQLAAEADGEGLAKTLAERDEVRIIDYTGGPGFGAWLEENGAARGQLVYTEKAGVNSIVVDSTDNLRGVLGNLAFSLTLYSGQMCTTRRTSTCPARASRPTRATCPSRSSASGSRRRAAAHRRRRQGGRAARRHRERGVRGNASGLAALAEEAGGTVVLDSREVSHPAYPEAVVLGLVAVDASREDVYTQECFGPVTYLIGTSGTDQALAQFRDTMREHGAMTAAVYSTSEEVLEQAREAAADAGVALSENLTGPVFVNQTAAFSDYHGTGANPAANAAYVDAAFVASRFRVVTSRRHV